MPLNLQHRRTNHAATGEVSPVHAPISLRGGSMVFALLHGNLSSWPRQIVAAPASFCVMLKNASPPAPDSTYITPPPLIDNPAVGCRPQW